MVSLAPAVAESEEDWRDICSGDFEVPPDGVLDYDDVDPFVTCLLTQP